MKRSIFAIALAAIAAPALAQVGVSVNINGPGIYGQINIGDAPTPLVIYAAPVVVVQAPEYRSVPPIYLHVPPGHEKHWRKHCAEYDACGRPVYFVRHDWYDTEYAPRHRHDGDEPGEGHHEKHGEKHGRDHEGDHGHEDKDH